MPFQKGQSGNPLGRPKRDPNAVTEVSVRRALERVVRTRPDVLENAIERLLTGSRSSLGMLELAAKLTRELQDEAQGNRIAIVFTGTLNSQALKQVDAKVIECPAESNPMAEINASSLTMNQALLADSSLKTELSAVVSMDRLEPVSQPQE